MDPGANATVPVVVDNTVTRLVDMVIDTMPFVEMLQLEDNWPVGIQGRDWVDKLSKLQ